MEIEKLDEKTFEAINPNWLEDIDVHRVRSIAASIFRPDKYRKADQLVDAFVRTYETADTAEMVGDIVESIDESEFDKRTLADIRTDIVKSILVMLSFTSLGVFAVVTSGGPANLTGKNKHVKAFQAVINDGKEQAFSNDVLTADTMYEDIRQSFEFVAAKLDEFGALKVK